MIVAKRYIPAVTRLALLKVVPNARSTMMAVFGVIVRRARRRRLPGMCGRIAAADRQQHRQVPGHDPPKCRVRYDHRLPARHTYLPKL